MIRTHPLLLLLPFLGLFHMSTISLKAQVPAAAPPGGAQVSREELAALLTMAEDAEHSAAYSLLFRDRAAVQARMIRQRLDEGDFRVGDQIVLTVRDEDAISGTFTVQAGSQITIPEIGNVPLSGVLRSELNHHLSDHLSRFVRDPNVVAHALFRIMVSGAVGQPGYYVVPAQALISDAIMQAGGFAAGADLERVEIIRAGSRIWTGSELQEAIAAGRTFDELSLTAGDHLVVHSRPPGGAVTSVRTWLMTVPALVVTITAIRQFF